MAHDCIQQDTIKDLAEFKGATESNITTLFNLVSDIKNNDLKHITDKLDKVKNSLSNRPSWVVFWIITTLTAILIGIISYNMGRLIH
jgi:hypothetical protein